MARLRTQNELITSLIEFYRVSQPLLDTKPGSVARDLFVEGPSAQISRLYRELGELTALQSLRAALGIDLDKLADNFGLKRRRGSKATGVSLYTFNSLDADFAVTSGNLSTARNGATFSVVNSTIVSTIFASQYKATAARYKADLDFVGITDQYAIEVFLEATTPGVSGNISKYSLNISNTSNINNVTNPVAFGGGTGAEDDANFKNRILSVFSGSNTGTATGYANAVKADPAVLDVVVIEPGDSLMTRDGTQVSTASDGTRTVTVDGTGGKVDVLVFGTRVSDTFDTFIYRDKSNTNDATNSKNDFVLGKIIGDENKTITRRRRDNLANKTLPTQPTVQIIQVTGSLSGDNFKESTTDSLGRTTGNYQLIKDDGDYAGSVFGYDRLHWISNEIEGFSEEKTKSQFNNQDSLSYTDVSRISSVTQSISIINENSQVLASDRSLIQLSHYPINSVTRVFNATTGERYRVISQNPDGGTTNTTGRVRITGKSLPAISDILQVDYTWIFSYDGFLDFDNKLNSKNIRTVQDSIDWGYSNIVARESAVLISSGSYLTAKVTHPISTVTSVNVTSTLSTTIGISSSRLSVTFPVAVTNIVSISRTSDGAELWNTSKSDGTFSALTAYLPTDTVAVFNDPVTVVYNAVDVYNTATPGNFSSNTITIVPSVTATAGTIVECNYIANVSEILPSTTISNLPAIKSGNAFNTVNSSGIGSQPTTHITVANVIQKNLRKSPSNLSLTVGGSISPGVITVTGTTFNVVNDAIITVSSAGLTHDLSSALRTALGLNSQSSIPTNIKLAKIARVQKVTATDTQVLTTEGEYDITGYGIADNSYVKSEGISASSLNNFQFRLPSTTANLNLSPNIGDKLLVTFHYVKGTDLNADSENVNFSKSGTLYTNKKFAVVKSISISSGFTSGASASATLTVNNLNQPATKSRYRVYYNYTAPKTNERITIKHKYDRLIVDSTLAIESARPINADVLVKSAVPVLISIKVKVIISTEFINSSTTILQNVKDNISNLINSQKLGTTLDASDIVNSAYDITGIDSARIIYFNKSNKAGSVLAIKAQKNQYIVADSVTVELESR